MVDVPFTVPGNTKGVADFQGEITGFRFADFESGVPVGCGGIQ